MRSLALISLLGSFIASTNLVGQSLTEHAAAAAGATLGTAAGKPLGGALGKAFGEVDKSPRTSHPNTRSRWRPNPRRRVQPSLRSIQPQPEEHLKEAAGTPLLVEAEEVRPLPAQVATVAKLCNPVMRPTARSFPSAPGRAQRSDNTRTSGRASRHHRARIKEPSAQDVAGIRVGATSSELRQALGTPESTVSIPGDDGHLLEIRQYWANGEPVGTVRLDNGHVVSVRPNN